MSGFGRGPNVSQYIANLNTIPQPAGPVQQQQPPQQQQQQQQAGQDQLAFDDDLALFTNSELFDFDLDNVKQEAYLHHAKGQHGKQAAGKRDANVNYNNAPNYMFDPAQPMAPLNTNFPNGNFDPQLFQSPQSATFPSHAAMNAPSPTSAGQKRTYSSSSPGSPVEDVARMAAEEDKRRRNTAASARFRVKKKQREAALEKSAKENADRVDNLQKRVNELEMENKWLRELVVQKESKSAKDDGSKSSTGTDADTATIASKQVKKGVGTEETA